MKATRVERLQTLLLASATAGVIGCGAPTRAPVAEDANASVMDDARDAAANEDADARGRNDGGLDSDIEDACATEESSVDFPLVAFPGAEGFGAETVGGRGGRVIEVTSLDDGGAGSLRAAIDASGPRIVVFRVGGTITLDSGLVVREPFLTVAGQTAPGDGILLRNAGQNNQTGLTIANTAHDIVVRHLRIRPGPAPNGQNLDGIAIFGRRVVIDHCSISWSVDELFSTWFDPQDVTVQWSMLAEPLSNSTHPEGAHAMGLLIGNETTRFTAHHNYLAHGAERAPRVQGGFFQFINNVVYDYANFIAAIRPDYNPVFGIFVGNHYRRGPASAYTAPVVRPASTGVTMFADGNRREDRAGVIQSENVVGFHQQEPLSFFTDLGFPPVVASTAADSVDAVLAGAGATLPRRDAVDQRLVRTYRDGGGGLVDDPADVGGFPSLASGTPLPDRDHDGMSDQWEVQYGFDPDDSSDGTADADMDGYTNVEEELNGTRPVTANCR